MSLETKLISLAQAIGADVKVLRNNMGDLTSLPTTNKNNLVAAIQEMYLLIGEGGGGGAVIDDTAGNGDTTVVWSADKSFDSIAAAVAALKTDILGGAGAAYDTFKELQDLLVADEGAMVALTAAVNNRVRFDEATTLTNAQKVQARSNIDAASGTGVGDTEHDFVADYTTAKT